MIKTTNTGAIPNVLDRADEHPLLGTTKHPSPFFKKVNRSAVSWIEDSFVKACEFHREDRIREDRNHRFFTALNRAHYSKEVLDKVASGELNIDLSQFNFLMKKVTGFVGAMMKNPHDIEFIAQSPDFIDSAILLKHLMFKDKEVGDWDDHVREAIKNGIIYGSFVRIGVTTKHHELGNMEIQCMKPGTVLTDPSWDSDDLAKCSYYMTVVYMNAYTAKETYPHKSSRIDSAIRRMYENSIEYTQRDGHAFTEHDLHDLYDQRYRFIEFHHMVDEEVLQMIGLTPDGTYVEVPEPPKAITKSEHVNEWLDQWYAVNHVDKKSVFTRKHKISKYYVTTVCAALDTELAFDDNLGVIQAGRLPMTHFSYLRHGGKNIGLIDVLADSQTTFNKNMSLILELIAKAAKDGQVYEPNAFGNKKSKMDEFEKKSARPGFKMAAEPGYIENGGRIFAEIPNSSGQIAQQTQQNANQMFDLLNQLTPQTLAMEGMNESSKETGRLFMEKRAQGEVTMDTVTAGIARMMRDIGRIWRTGVNQFYSDVYRRVTDSNGKVIELNKVEYTPEGMQFISNNIALMPEHEVVVSVSPSGLTQRIGDQISSLELIRILPPEMKLTSVNLTSRIIKSLDNYSKKDKEAFLADLDTERILIKTQIETQIANNEATTAQAKAIVQQMSQPPAPPAPPAGQGDATPEQQQSEMVEAQMKEMGEGPIPPEGGQPGMEQQPVRTPAQFG